jgi:glycosyltransferase involved in cell wall biosynthesis
MDKQLARQQLNIPADRPVISFGAISITSPYKGWEYLKAAIQKLYEAKQFQDVFVLIFGGSDNQEIAKSIPFETQMMGYVNDEEVMTKIYNASDVFIAPSLADNLPYTVFEALSCGTPVVGFRTGGIPDLIAHKENGYLVEYKNIDDLVKGINYCLENDISGYVLQDMSRQSSMKKHLALLRSILKNGQK